MYVDPITRQTFNYATPIECGNNPQNIIELDPDTDDGDFYVLTPDPLKREAPQMFKLTQIKTTITPNTFTAQDDSHTGSNPYNHLRIGFHDHLLNLLPLLNPDWFSQAFINYFGYPCYILTQCGIYFYLSFH